MSDLKMKESKFLSAYFLPNTFVIEEMVEPVTEALKIWIEAFETDKYRALYHLGILNRENWFSPSLDYLHYIAEILIKKISQQSDIEFNRETVEIYLSEDELDKLKQQIPFVIGSEFVDDDWIQSIWEAMLTVFKSEIRSYEGTVARYFAEHNSNINVVGRVFFHLVESKEAQFPFAFMATYSTKPVKSKRAVHTPLKNALAEFEGDEKKLLALISTVIKAAEKSAFISELLESGELFSPLKLTTDEAYIVLKEMELYEDVGIMCRVPDWWRKRNNSVKLSVAVGEKEPSKVGLDAILDFCPTISIGENDITEQELKAFLYMAEGLVQYKGKWVEIDKKKLEAVLLAFDKVKNQTQSDALSLADALRFELNQDKFAQIGSDHIELSISNGQWLKTLKESLIHPNRIEKVDIVPSFRAELRAYQETGYDWLNKMSTFGLGACLADDMGLGKTVQMIAFLEHRRVHIGGKALLILPASLIGNWQKEIEKFAPEMPYQILHKSDVKQSDALQINEAAFLYITTYGMAVRLDVLTERRWDYLILDEAQAIKNPGTKQTKAIKAIPATMKIAMTGTPIENRLGDLWSLFDFLNQGLLGTTT